MKSTSFVELTYHIRMKMSTWKLYR